VGNTWAGWGSIPVVFSPGMTGTRVSSYVRCPFLSKEHRRISERDDLSPPFVPGGQEIGLGPRTSRERIGDGGGPETVWALVCFRKACHKAKRRVEV
jgi:hypothetical protein